MKYALYFFLLFSISTLQISCFDLTEDENKSANNPDFDEKYEQASTPEVIENSTGQIGKTETVNYFNNIDSRNGIVMSRTPLPSTWQKQKTGDYSYIGPDGIKVYVERVSMFMFSNDQQTNYVNQQSGIPTQFPKSVDQVINESFMDYANKINRKLVKKYPIPQLAAWDRRFDDQLYKSMPSQKTFSVVGLEWRDPDGTSFLTVLHHFVSYDNYGGYWGIIYTVLEASENAFEKAKRQYLNGLLNQQTNPQWVQVRNQNEMQIAQQSNAVHQTTMAGIKAAGAQGTANHNARMAAMDKNMDNWRANQASGDRAHSQVIDNIHGNTTIRDPNTGSTYKVEAGADQYWINNQGEYIKSDNSLYNPNLDNGINNQTWMEYEEQN